MDKEIISWIDANGVEHILTDQPDINITIGPSGRYMPPIETSEDEMPFQHGSKPRKTKVKAREMDFPTEVYGKTQMDIRYKLRQLLRMFDPLKGMGRIKSVSPDGSVREISCLYQGGLEISESGMIRENFVLVLKAYDPFWNETITQVKTFTPGQPATFFPMFPFRLTSSSVFADDTIENEGDVEAYPEWIITGPGENINLKNLTTGEVLKLDTSLQEGETIIINTQPRTEKMPIVKGDGTNLFHTMSDESSRWTLQEGKNNIRIEMSGANLQSSVQVSYKKRYWGP
jgi:phage-related protein